VARAVAPDAVLSFSPRALVLQRELPGCPGDVVTLAVQDGRVVVLAGRPGDLGPVLSRTDIPARGLPPAERRRLENGYAVPAASAGAVLATLRAASRPPAEPSGPGRGASGSRAEGAPAPSLAPPPSAAGARSGRRPAR
jgi:hypothetical protein